MATSKDNPTPVTVIPPNVPKVFPNAKKVPALKKQDITKGDAKGVDAQQQAKNVREKDKEEPTNEFGGIHKVGERKITKMYVGDITAKSVSSETGEEISIRMHIPTPVTEEGVWTRFLAHHASAIRDEFEIDETNTTDPMLRTSFGG